MRKKLVAGLATVLFFLGGAGMLSATLISTDLIEGSGDGLLTFDTETLLEWLDLTETTNQSYNDVMAGFGH